MKRGSVYRNASMRLSYLIVETRQCETTYGVALFCSDSSHSTNPRLEAQKVLCLDIKNLDQVDNSIIQQNASLVYYILSLFLDLNINIL